jgi:hypothetical protein
MTFAEHAKEQIGVGAREWKITQFIDNQHFDARVAAD